MKNQRYVGQIVRGPFNLAHPIRDLKTLVVIEWSAYNSEYYSSDSI